MSLVHAIWKDRFIKFTWWEGLDHPVTNSMIRGKVKKERDSKDKLQSPTIAKRGQEDVASTYEVQLQYQNSGPNSQQSDAINSIYNSLY